MTSRPAEFVWNCRLMAVLITVVVATLLVSALCSLLEAAFYSTRVVTLEAAKADGKHRRAADQLLRMKKDVATPTSAILILNTIANTAGATFAGMYAAAELGAKWLPAFSAVLTLLILLFSEILPKTYGASNWSRIWPVLTWPLAALVRGLSPLVWLTRQMTRLVTRSASLPVVTEEEIRATIRLGAKGGELSANEIQMLESVFHFDETTCVQVMVPRSDVHCFDVAEPTSSLAALWAKTQHTRYPVCRGSLDDVVGVVHAKDLVGVPLSDRFDIETLVRPIAQVPESLSISRLLREMQTSRRQVALVVDEYGNTTGLVTLKDVLEEIVGALHDEHEHQVADIARDGEAYLIRGNVPLAKVNRELGLDLYDPAVVTLSGLLVAKLSRLLKPGDQVELDGVLAEVLEVRGNRAHLVRLEKIPGADERPSEPTPQTTSESAT